MGSALRHGAVPTERAVPLGFVRKESVRIDFHCSGAIASHAARRPMRNLQMAYDRRDYGRLTMSHRRLHARMHFRNVVRFVGPAVRSRAQVAAENLFLRKQLAFYVERQVKTRRADDATRIVLVALSRLIEWRRILTIIKPDTLMGWHRQAFSCSGRGNHDHAADRECRRICDGSSRRSRPGIARAVKSEIAAELLVKRRRTLRRYLPNPPCAARGHAVAAVEHSRAESRNGPLSFGDLRPRLEVDRGRTRTASRSPRTILSRTPLKTQYQD